MRTPFLTSMFGALVFAAIPAKAVDGYICKSVDEDVVVKLVLAPKLPSQTEENRTADMMIVSSPLLSSGRQTIARFRAKEGMLNSAGSVFVGFVDLRHPDTSQKGKRIGGTTLGQLKAVILDIDYAPEYRSVRRGLPLSAQVIYSRRKGNDLIQEFDCVYKQD